MPYFSQRLGLFGAAFALLIAAGGPARAHPHVFVDGRAEIIFDGHGRMTAVRNVWEFDRAFSAFASQGLDKNGDGKLSAEELAPLAKTNVESLKHYGFFTVLSVGGKHLKLKFPDQYFLRSNAGQLTLFFQLPLETPTAPGPSTTLEVYDPEYFVAFTFVKDKPITLFAAPTGCVAAYHPPKPLNASIMAQLAAVPVDQHDLPRALRDAALGLANVFTMDCPP
ncbi:MAG: DUF1007 family protein [Rhodopseudomonas sp.]|nr:DUF1007 family protein [Rhodopseudomonas sp.]